MRRWPGLVFALFGGAALAAPSISKMDEPDKQGILHYTVKCEGGGATLVQCLRDGRHCGYASDLSVEAIAEQACETILLNRAVPATPSEPGVP